MRHAYKKIVAYNPAENLVTAYLKVPEDAIFNSRASDEAFYDVYMSVDKVTNMIIGVSLTGNMYQLSPAGYGTYVKEDEKSIAFINRSKLLVAISNYMKKHNIPFDY